MIELPTELQLAVGDVLAYQLQVAQTLTTYTALAATVQYGATCGWVCYWLNNCTNFHKYES